MQAVREYTLPPQKYVQAVEFARAQNVLYFAGFGISVLALLVILRLRVVPRLRRLHAAWIICAVTLLTAFCDLPTEIYGHRISLRYGLSIQGWPSWLADWGKEQALALALAIAVLWPFYWLLRRSPKRWWLYAWLIALPVMALGAYASPLLIEPLFNRFQPLAVAHPELIRPIEQLLARARIRIPRDHLLEMRASDKSTALNAYVSGFGPSRRLVLYDTIIRAEKGPPLLATIGHELGHDALHHIPKGLAYGAAGALLGLALLYICFGWFVHRWGPSLDIPSTGDWASLPALLLLVTLITFFAQPIGNALSRWQEHQADLYSLEVIHGVVADPGQAAARSFQIEGERDLEEPNPSPFVVFWLYSHPPIAQRIRFSLTYDPWLPGRHPKYVQPQRTPNVAQQFRLLRSSRAGLKNHIGGL